VAAVRVRCFEREEAGAVDELADIGPTYADGGDPDQDVTLARLRKRCVLDPDIPRPVIPDRSHSVLPDRQ